jgi:hypothetical protein
MIEASAQAANSRESMRANKQQAMMRDDVIALINEESTGYVAPS